jgi:hypothetical protein
MNCGVLFLKKSTRPTQTWEEAGVSVTQKFAQFIRLQ